MRSTFASEFEGKKIQNQFGSPQVLKVKEVPAPSISKNEVLVEVHASCVTQGDRRLRAADYPGISRVVGRLMFGIFTPRHPTGGTNFAGGVLAVGSEVTRFSKLKAGERVLVVGAAGGVGRYAIQLGNFYGAEVTGVCARDSVSLVKKLGTHRVIDYESVDYTAGENTYDVIFDTHSGDGYRRAKASLSSSGRYVTLYLNLLVLVEMLLSSFGKGPKVLSSVALGSQKVTEDVAELVKAGAFRPHVSKRYSLARISEAHQELESGSRRGEVVVSIKGSARAA